MSKRKDVPFEENKRSENRINQRIDPADPIAGNTLRQDITLSKGERERDLGPASAVGKKGEGAPRKGTK